MACAMDSRDRDDGYDCTRFRVVFGLVFSFGLADGLAVGHAFGLKFGLAFGLVFGLVWGSVFGLMRSGVWPAFLAAAQIAARWRSPLSLMRFLEDAHKRNVLRTVGQSYQFRHARLQNRLAASFPEDASREPDGQAAGRPPAEAQNS